MHFCGKRQKFYFPSKKDKQQTPIVSQNLKGNCKDLSTNIEGGQTLKTETAGGHGGVTQVCIESIIPIVSFLLNFLKLEGLWPDAGVSSPNDTLTALLLISIL